MHEQNGRPVVPAETKLHSLDMSAGLAELDNWLGKCPRHHRVPTIWVHCCLRLTFVCQSLGSVESREALVIQVSAACERRLPIIRFRESHPSGERRQILIMIMKPVIENRVFVRKTERRATHYYAPPSSSIPDSLR